MKKFELIDDLQNLLKIDEITAVRKRVQNIISNTNRFKKELTIQSNGNPDKISKLYLVKELSQIKEAYTLERTRYYIRRLIKSLSQRKEGKINDINLNRWKEYDDLLTDSLWIIDKRDKSGAHTAGYWGNFIPQIPNQFLRRYTRKGEWVLDPFLGSGTTLIECKRLGRNGIGVELQREAANMAGKIIGKEKNPYNITTEIINGDSTRLNFASELKNRNCGSVQFLILHPPYWDIIKFSRNKNDLSNAKSADEFLKMFGKIIDGTYHVLDKGRYAAVIIGDKYCSGEWIPLGFFIMQEMIKRGYKLKSTIIKNFDQTTAKRNQKELWRYRALAGGFYIFKHEYIFLFQK
ncbi:MAG TPA: DNA methyltransferase [Ignavibacteriaceae bacterium]